MRAFTVSSPVPSFLLLPLLIALMVGSGSSSRAQSAGMDECSAGLLYYISFPDTIINEWDARFPSALIKADTKSFSLFIYSPVDQRIRIGRVNGVSHTVEVSGGQILDYETFYTGIPNVTQINAPQTSVVELRAQYPVIVYGYVLTGFGCAAFTPLPVESWGTEYYAAAWPGQIVRNIFPSSATNYRAIPKEAPAEILVIAAYDGTEVRITPTAELAECPTCRANPPVIRLNAGQVYQVQSVVDTALPGLAGQGDLGGTFIQASKPVGVISGNSRLMLNANTRSGLVDNVCKDMAFEWISPVEQHGTEFVFTPAWDDRSFQPGRDVDDLREGEYVRLFSTQEGINAAVRLGEGGDSLLNAAGPLESGEFATERIDVQRSVNEARTYKTSRSAFGVMSPESVIVPQSPADGTGSAAFDAWSTYMVELVPREQWTSFAPIAVPGIPDGMKHYLNVVTDTGSRFNVYVRQGGSDLQPFSFNRGTIPGTDLVWGSMELTGGDEYFIRGGEGARFTGHVYGSYKGREDFHPKGPETGGIAEYHEDIALMYGYPLAPSRCLLSPPDQYEVRAERDCGGATVSVRAVNPNPAGLRSITLLPDSSSNLQLSFVDPADSSAIIAGSLSETAVRITPADRKKDAWGVLVIHDRTRGGVERLRYRYEAERVAVDSAAGVDFGVMQTGQTAERTVTITNPLERDIVVRRVGFVLGGLGFRIIGTEPAFDWSSGGDSIVLRSGDSIRIRVAVLPTQDAGHHDDSLRVEFGCSEVRVRVRSVSAAACLFVGDLSFGTVERGGKKDLLLELCNNGEFPVSFHDSTAVGGGNLLSFSDTNFTVADNYRNLLGHTVLDPGDCVTIRVRFTANDTGIYRTTARFWINGRDCMDTSVWTAYAMEAALGVAGENLRSGNELTEVAPNPFTGETRIAFRLAQGGETRVEIYDGEGRVVGTLLEKRLTAGEHEVRWNGRGYAAGTYYVRIRSGEWNTTQQILLVR